jgi:hypothetical protein
VLETGGEHVRLRDRERLIELEIALSSRVAVLSAA